MQTQNVNIVRKSRVIVHVDMDAFFAAVEQLDNPLYRNRPVVVGADPQEGKGRGVVAAASYEARRFGIHSAMPISKAYRLCPEAVYLRPRFKRYEEVSEHVMRILGEFSPLVEQLSIDEAFLDCTGTEKLLGSPGDIARKIKERIKSETGLTASVGVATNKAIAKIASDLKKPDGLVVCAEGKEREFMASLPLKYLWGAGKKTISILESMGFKKVGDLAASDPERLTRVLGKYGVKLWELANGIDERPVQTTWERKSIGEEVTFNKDLSEDNKIEGVLFRIADTLTRKMRGEGIKGRTITLKIRLQGFETHTRSRTLDKPVDEMKTIRDTALTLFRNFDRKGKKVRLVGISVSNLKGMKKFSESEPELFSEGVQEPGRKMDIDRVLDRMKKLYGEKVTRAALLPPS
ncbi:MAG: DNA polymerase IV [Spirochaetota bacterium]